MKNARHLIASLGRAQRAHQEARSTACVAQAQCIESQVIRSTTYLCRSKLAVIIPLGTKFRRKHLPVFDSYSHSSSYIASAPQLHLCFVATVTSHQSSTLDTFKRGNASIRPPRLDAAFNG